MPRLTTSASGASHHAKTVGPAPEIEHPRAPAAIAACLTRSKPGMSRLRCGSITTSSSEARMRPRSDVKQPATNPARFACCQTASDRLMVRARIFRATSVATSTCGCTSTQRITSGTGIRVTMGWSMPTVRTSPP